MLLRASARKTFPHATTALHPFRRRFRSSRHPSRTISVVTFTRTASMSRARTAVGAPSLRGDKVYPDDDEHDAERAGRGRPLAEEEHGGDRDEDVAQRRHRVRGEERMSREDRDPE